MATPEDISIPRIERIENDIDIRIFGLLEGGSGKEDETIGVFEALEKAPTSSEKVKVILAFLRAAYGRGYTDALMDPLEENLYQTHKYRMPTRRPPTPKH